MSWCKNIAKGALKINFEKVFEAVNTALADKDFTISYKETELAKCREELAKITSENKELKKEIEELKKEKEW